MKIYITGTKIRKVKKIIKLMKKYKVKIINDRETFTTGNTETLIFQFQGIEQ